MLCRARLRAHPASFADRPFLIGMFVSVVVMLMLVGFMFMVTSRLWDFIRCFLSGFSRTRGLAMTRLLPILLQLIV
jgi:hypothetical protein